MNGEVLCMVNYLRSSNLLFLILTFSCMGVLSEGGEGKGEGGGGGTFSIDPCNPDSIHGIFV